MRPARGGLVRGTGRLRTCRGGREDGLGARAGTGRGRGRSARSPRSAIRVEPAAEPRCPLRIPEAAMARMGFGRGGGDGEGPLLRGQLRAMDGGTDPADAPARLLLLRRWNRPNA